MSVVDFGVFTPEPLLEFQDSAYPSCYIASYPEVKEYAEKMLATVSDPNASIEFLVQWHLEETIWHAEWKQVGRFRMIHHTELVPGTRAKADRSNAAINAKWREVAAKYRIDPAKPPKPYPSSTATSFN